MKARVDDRVIDVSWEREPCPDRPELTQRRRLMCEWGPFVNSEGDPRLGLDKLILVVQDSVDRMLANGPEPAVRGGRATWELFPARMKGKDRTDLLVGRWPD